MPLALKKIHYAYLFFVLHAVMACSNYGLKDKLENPGGGTGTADRLYIFVSSISTNGDTTGLVNGGCGSIGVGINRADCSCTELARSAGLLRSSTSKFVAWLSDNNNNDMTCRINGGTGANCSNTGGPSWYNTFNELIATGYADLFDSALNAAIKYTENRTPSAFATVWSGTDANGLRTGAGVAANNCSGWTTTAGTGTTGSIGAVDAFWSNNAGIPTCNAAPLPVYCIAQP